MQTLASRRIRNYRCQIGEFRPKSVFQFQVNSLFQCKHRDPGRFDSDDLGDFWDEFRAIFAHLLAHFWNPF